jgi:asparagine synthase (glutamine-hydrolysing)
MAQDLLLSPRAVQRAYFRPAVVARMLDEHLQERADHGEDLWDLLVLEVWHRTFVDAGARTRVPHRPVASVV